MDKLVESNGKLPPITADTVDNLPNPLPDPTNPHFPPNEPPISNLNGYFTRSLVGGNPARASLPSPLVGDSSAGLAARTIQRSLALRQARAMGAA